MAGYIGIQFETDPDALTAEALDALASRYPGFSPKEAHLEVWLTEVFARMNSGTRNVAHIVTDDIFRYYGASLVGVPPVDPVSATALTTWVMQDDSGYTIEEGTVVAYRISGDTIYPFETTETRTVLPGATTLVDVPIRSIETGTKYNNLGPAGLELVDSLSFVSSITASAATSDGVDPESDQEYMNRLKEEMTLLTPRFVLATDAVVLARRIAGVHRALGIDNYNPGDNTFNNEKMITVAVVAEDGSPLSVDIKNQVDAYLQSLREINFMIHVVDPTYTNIDVDFQVVPYAGYDPGDLSARCRAAVSLYLSPATWGGGGDDPPTWRITENVVRYLEVAEVLNQVEGVHYVKALTVNGGVVNVTLNGVAPLPTVGAVTGSTVDE